MVACSMRGYPEGGGPNGWTVSTYSVYYRKFRRGLAFCFGIVWFRFARLLSNRNAVKQCISRWRKLAAALGNKRAPTGVRNVEAQGGVELGIYGSFIR